VPARADTGNITKTGSAALADLRTDGWIERRKSDD